MDEEKLSVFLHKTEQRLEEIYVLLSGKPPGNIGLFERFRKVEMQTRIQWVCLLILFMLIIGFSAKEIVSGIGFI